MCVTLCPTYTVGAIVCYTALGLLSNGSSVSSLHGFVMEVQHSR